MPATPQQSAIQNQNWRRRRPGYADWIQGQHGTATQQVLISKQNQQEAEWQEWQQSNAQANALAAQTRHEETLAQNQTLDDERQAAADESAWRSTGPTIQNLTSGGGGAPTGSTMGGVNETVSNVTGNTWLGNTDFGNILSGAGAGFGLSRTFGDPDDHRQNMWYGAGGGALGSFLGGGSWADIIGGSILGGGLGAWH